MDEMLALIPSSERPLVTDLASRLCREADSNHIDITHRVGTVVAAIVPRLGFDKLALLVRYAVWTIELDDQLDGRDADPATLARIRDDVAAVLGLSRTPVMIRFGRSLREAIDAGIRHATAQGKPATVEEYLEVAARSVNYKSFAYLLLALTDPKLTDDLLDRIDAALTHAARAVRLGNDLRSVDRDRIEGTPNVLDLHHAGGAAVSRQFVMAEIERSIRAHHDMLAGLNEAAPLVRCLALSVGMYRLTDLR